MIPQNAAAKKTQLPFFVCINPLASLSFQRSTVLILFDATINFTCQFRLKNILYNNKRKCVATQTEKTPHMKLY